MTLPPRVPPVGRLHPLTVVRRRIEHVFRGLGYEVDAEGQPVDPNDWGLGFEIKGTKDPHWTGNNNAPQTFGHFGWAGSFLWVDPKVHLAAVFVGDQPFSEEHQEAWPELSDAILADHAVLR